MILILRKKNTLDIKEATNPGSRSILLDIILVEGRYDREVEIYSPLDKADASTFHLIQ
jgi:hypothetical protein